MNNLKISKLQYACLFIFPILSFFSGVGFYDLIKLSGIDSYISIVISSFFGLIIMGMIIYIFNYEEELSLSNKNIVLFGTFWGNIINFIIFCLIFMGGVVIIYSISNFIVSQFLADTPVYVILFFLGIVSIYSASKGIEVIARAAIVFFIIIIILTLISTLGLIPLFKLSNLQPILEYGINKPLIAGVSFCLTNIVPIVVLLCIPKSKIIKSRNISKYLLIAYFIALFLTFISSILTIGVLGGELLKLFPHPEYMVLKEISILGFIDRIENIIFVKWLFNDFVSLSLIIYFLSNTIIKKDKQKILPIIITIGISILSQILFKDNAMFKWFVLNIYTYINLVLLFIIILITIRIFMKKMI